MLRGASSCSEIEGVVLPYRHLTSDRIDQCTTACEQTDLEAGLQRGALLQQPVLPSPLLPLLLREPLSTLLKAEAQAGCHQQEKCERGTLTPGCRMI